MGNHKRDLYSETAEDTYEKDKYMKAEQLLSKIEEMEGKFVQNHELRNKAFVCFLYLSAMRIEEVTDYILEPRKNKKGEMVIKERIHIGDPLRKSNIEDFSSHIIIYGVRTLKRTKPGKERGKLKRNIPILDWGIDSEFLKILREYLKTLKEERYFLFPFTRQRGNQILEKVGLHPHQLRHIRLTHLTTKYGFKPSHLLDFVGWTTVEPTATYVHLDTSDLLEKMIDRAKEIDKLKNESSSDKE